MRDRWTRTDLQGRKLYWLLDLTFAGQVYRVASDAVSVSSDNGSLLYVGGLNDFRLNETLDLFSDSPSAPSVSLEVLVPADVPSLVAAGHRLGRATAELSQVRDGDAWEDRCVRIRGRLNDPQHGRAEDPIRFTLKQPVYLDTGSIPDAGASVAGTPSVVNSAHTLPITTTGPFPSVELGTSTPALLANADLGIPYPVIIGNPGKSSQVFGGWMPGSQAVWGNKEHLFHGLILAGHRVAASQVYISTSTDTIGQLVTVIQNGSTDSEGATVDYCVDARGIAIAIVSDDDGPADTPSSVAPNAVRYGLEDTSLSSIYRPAVPDALEVYVGWYDGGGLVGSDGEVMRGAGDVLKYLLERTSLTVDIGRLSAALPYLNRFHIDACIEAFTRPMAWIAHHLLPLLPCALTVGPSGIYPVVWRYDATSRDAVATLDADLDPRIQVGPTLTWDTSRIANDFTIQYGYDLRGNTYRHTARLGAHYVSGASTSYAAGALNGWESKTDSAQSIQLVAVAAGPTGTVRVTMTEGSGRGVTDSVATNTAVVTYDGSSGSPDTVDELVATIGGSALVTASTSFDSATSAASTTFGAAGYDLDITLVYEDTSTISSPYCRLSQAAYENEDHSGLYPMTLESQVIYERETADLVLASKARLLAMEHLTFPVLAPFEDWAWLELGAVVLVTFASLGLDAVLCVIEEREEANDGMIGFRLRHVADPTTDDG